MALHRDIHWIGRQWAVTGRGMQLIDQKLQGFFDIEVARLWDENLITTMHAKEWLNAVDFDKGLAVARARYPQSPAAVPPSLEAVPVSAVDPVAPLPLVAERETSDPGTPKPETLQREHPPPVPVVAAPEPVEPPKQDAENLRMGFLGHGRFVRPWRVWMKR